MKYKYDPKDVKDFMNEVTKAKQRKLDELRALVSAAETEAQNAYNIRDYIEEELRAGRELAQPDVARLSQMRWPVTDVVEELWDNSIRVEAVIWLAAQGDGSEQCEDFFEDRGREELENIFGLKFPFDPADVALEEVLSFLCRRKKTGFLVNAATPIPSRFSKDGGYSHSWGHYQTEWFYTEAFDENFAVRLLEWHDNLIAEKRKEHAQNP